jgi:hypothetical protein
MAVADFPASLSGGDKCGGTNFDRQLTISFLCSSEQGMSEFSHERVIEDHCHYKLTVNTVFGYDMRSCFSIHMSTPLAPSAYTYSLYYGRIVNRCPNECHIGANRQLCSGHGFCGMDHDASKPRCLCYETFYGEACDVESSGASLDFLGDALILTILLLTGLLISSVCIECYVYFKVHKLHRRKMYEIEDTEATDVENISIDDTSDL